MQAKANMAALLMMCSTMKIPSDSPVHHPDNLVLCFHEPRWQELDYRKQAHKGMAQKRLYNASPYSPLAKI